MRDVAQYASVSLSTVSYVISGRRSGSDRISTETRQLVLDAIDSLGYVPNRTAQSLRRQKTERVCLAIPRLGVPGYDYVAQALLEACDAEGYTFITALGRADIGSTSRSYILLRRVEPYLLLLPVIIVLTIFFFGPAIYNVWLSLHDISLFQIAQGERFVGIGNYERLFNNPVTWNIL